MTNQENGRQLSSKIKSARIQADWLNCSRAHRNANLLSRLFKTGQGNIIDGNKRFAPSCLTYYRVWGKGLFGTELVSYRRYLLHSPMCLLNCNNLICVLTLEME